MGLAHPGVSWERKFDFEPCCVWGYPGLPKASFSRLWVMELSKKSNEIKPTEPQLDPPKKKSKYFCIIFNFGEKAE
jgi:hypothetical protein